MKNKYNNYIESTEKLANKLLCLEQAENVAACIDKTTDKLNKFLQILDKANIDTSNIMVPTLEELLVKEDGIIVGVKKIEIKTNKIVVVKEELETIPKRESVELEYCDKLPEGFSQGQFEELTEYLQKLINKDGEKGILEVEEIVVQGSRVNGLICMPEKKRNNCVKCPEFEKKKLAHISDLDIAIIVSENEFTRIKRTFFNLENGRDRGKLARALWTGKINSDIAEFSNHKNELEKIFGLEIDLSIIRRNSIFDNGPFIKVPLIN